MFYVEIAVKTKTSLSDNSFIYSVPKEWISLLAPGSLVQTPFGRRTIEGVVLRVRKAVPQSLKAKIRPITKVLSPEPILSKIHLWLAEWMQEYYLCSLGEAISAITLLRSSAAIKNWRVAPRRLFVSKPKIYAIYDRIDGRISCYSKLIYRALEANRQVVILFPNSAYFDYALNKIKSIVPGQEIVLVHSSLGRKELSRRLQKIQLGEARIIIGSRLAIFAPCSSLGLIIVDQPEDSAYKEEQSPRYHVLTVAQKLAGLSGAHLLLGSLYPNAQDFYFEQRGLYKILKKPTLDREASQVEIIDSAQQKSLIPWNTEQAIRQNLNNKKPIFIFVNRRGAGSSVGCSDCGYECICPHCAAPLTPLSLKSSILECNQCHKRSTAPVVCPNCGSSRLKNKGLGVQKVCREIKGLFPLARTIVVEKGTPNMSTNDYDIIIGTKRFLERPLFDFHLIIAIGLDSLLSLPDFRSREKALGLVWDLLSRTKEKLLIQTFNAKSDIWQKLVNKQFKQFLAEELKNRKRFNYPPYITLAALYFRHNNLQKAEQEAARVADQLKDFNFLGPNPCFITKIRDKYQYQIVVKLRNVQEKSTLKKIMINLPKGWRVDVDPVSLL